MRSTYSMAPSRPSSPSRDRARTRSPHRSSKPRSNARSNTSDSGSSRTPAISRTLSEMSAATLCDCSATFVNPRLPVRRESDQGLSLPWTRLDNLRAVVYRQNCGLGTHRVRRRPVPPRLGASSSAVVRYRYTRKCRRISYPTNCYLRPPFRWLFRPFRRPSRPPSRSFPRPVR